MTYRVHWTKEAINQLAAIWNASRDREAVTEASYRINRTLAAAPAEQGEERPPRHRIMFDSPLVVIYRIDEAKNRVVVVNCRQY